MKNGKYLVCPTSEGSLVFYDKKQPTRLVDKIPYTQGSINAIVNVI